MRNKRNLYFDNFLNKVESKSISISIIGLGYVGLPRALNFCNEKIIVNGIDINEIKINSLKK